MDSNDTIDCTDSLSNGPSATALGFSEEVLLYETGGPESNTVFQVTKLAVDEGMVCYYLKQGRSPKVQDFSCVTP